MVVVSPIGPLLSCARLIGLVTIPPNAGSRAVPGELTHGNDIGGVGQG